MTISFDQNTLDKYNVTDDWNDCFWQIAKKKGTDEEFFIKQFLRPKYPSLGTDAKQRQIRAETWFNDRKKIFDAVDKKCGPRGSLVIPVAFFRKNSTYYKITAKIPDGYTVNDVVKLSINDKLQVFLTMAGALEILHEENFVHADLKPQNILITKSLTGNMTCKIIDFDSGFYEGSFSADEMDTDVPNTPEYASPEVIRCNLGIPEQKIGPNRALKNEIDCKSDIFSLGLIFHECLTGKRIEHSGYGSPAGKALNEILKLGDNIPSYLSILIQSMVQKESTKRPDIKKVISILYTIKSGKFAVKKTGTAKKVINYLLYEKCQEIISISEKDYNDEIARQFPLLSYGEESDPKRSSAIIKSPDTKTPEPRDEHRPLSKSGKYAVKKTGVNKKVTYSLYEKGKEIMSISEREYDAEIAKQYPVKE